MSRVIAQYVGQPCHFGEQPDLAARQSVRVAAAIDALVVFLDDVEQVERDLGLLSRMTRLRATCVLNCSNSAGVRSPVLRKSSGWQADLAQILHQPGRAQHGEMNFPAGRCLPTTISSTETSSA